MGFKSKSWANKMFYKTLESSGTMPEERFRLKGQWAAAMLRLNYDLPRFAALPRLVWDDDLG